MGAGHNHLGAGNANSRRLTIALIVTGGGRVGLFGALE
jgi:hypothetical protein